MIKSKTNQSSQHFDAPSLGAEIVTLQGSTRQTYYVATKTYEDDRTLVPCILYADMQAAGKELQDILTGIEWYDRPPLEGDTTTGRISNPDAIILESTDEYDEDGVLVNPAAWRSYDLLISDGSNKPWCNGVPAGALIIRKNIPVKTSVIIYAVIKGIDPDTGSEMRMQRHEGLDTTLFDDSTVTISGSWGQGIVIDPLGIPEPLTQGNTVLDEPWWRQVTAQLHGVEGDVAPGEACYLWLIADSAAVTGFREMTAEEKRVMCVSGEKTATLRFDARLVCGELTLRCYGCRRDEGDTWTNPLSKDSPFYETTISIAINSTLEAVPRMIFGAKQGPEMNSPCSYEMEYRYNNKPVPAAKAVLMRAQWIGASLKTGLQTRMTAAPNQIFRPVDYSFPYPEGYALNAEVTVYAGCKPVRVAGNLVCDASGNVVISPTFG